VAARRAATRAARRDEEEEARAGPAEGEEARAASPDEAGARVASPDEAAARAGPAEERAGAVEGEAEDEAGAVEGAVGEAASGASLSGRSQSRSRSHPRMKDTAPTRANPTSTHLPARARPEQLPYQRQERAGGCQREARGWMREALGREVLAPCRRRARPTSWTCRKGSTTRFFPATPSGLQRSAC